ncbi:MAG: sulfotransferase domain-containing protein [Candidatus Nealsonbacteria bacterium]
MINSLEISNKKFKLDFLGIGASKSGTTWIFECLKEHPEICGSMNEEAGLFNSLKEGNRGSKPYSELYNLNFSHCKKEQLIGEYTPMYLADFEIIHLIKKHYPEIKLIICLRNPIERAYSQYLSYKLGGYISSKKTFEDVVKEGAENLFVKLGLYYSQVKLVFELFPRENILVLINEDIAKNPTEFIQKVYKFLGVDSNFVPSVVNKRIHQLPENPLKSPILNRTTILTLRVFRKKPLRYIALFLKKIGVDRLVNSINSKNLRKEEKRKPYKKPPIPKEVRERLFKIYQPDIFNLEKLINRNLSFWR